MRKKQKTTKSKQINKNPTTLVRIDIGVHQMVKIAAAKSRISIKTFVEGCLAEGLAIEKQNEQN